MSWSCFQISLSLQVSSFPGLLLSLRHPQHIMPFAHSQLNHLTQHHELRHGYANRMMILRIRSKVKAQAHKVRQRDFRLWFCCLQARTRAEGDKSDPDFEIPWLCWQTITQYPISPITYLMCTQRVLKGTKTVLFGHHFGKCCLF